MSDQKITDRFGPPSISPRAVDLGTLVRLVPKAPRAAKPSLLDQLKKIVAEVEAGTLPLDGFVLCMHTETETSDWIGYRGSIDMSNLEHIGLVSCVLHDLQDPSVETCPCPQDA
jgi:hypothetical protein